MGEVVEFRNKLERKLEQVLKICNRVINRPEKNQYANGSRDVARIIREAINERDKS